MALMFNAWLLLWCDPKVIWQSEYCCSKSIHAFIGIFSLLGIFVAAFCSTSLFHTIFYPYILMLTVFQHWYITHHRDSYSTFVVGQVNCQHSVFVLSLG